MNKKDKRKFTAAFKVKVAMEALKHDCWAGQALWVTSEADYGLEKTLSERLEELFQTKGKK